MAARKLKVNTVALTLGRTIHLHNVSAGEFLKNQKWVKHELHHIKQFQDFGFFNFLARYGWESMLKGYYLNKYEIEARLAEES